MLDFYDFEVFKYDWLVVIINPYEKSVTKICNDQMALELYYEQHKNEIWVGYNNKHYDQYIMKAILCGFDPKPVNDYIIKEKMQGWLYSSLFWKIKMINFDVMNKLDGGLKSLEGFMGNDIRETSVPFDIDRKLTDEEIQETFKYCTHDVEQTIKVFMNRIDEFNTIMYFIRHFGLSLSRISRTKPLLAAEILEGNCKGKNFNDEFQFPILDCIQLKKYRFVADWYKNPTNHDYSKKQKDVMIAGVPHTFAWGGGHGAIPKYHDTGVFIIADVTAYYPSLQQKYKFGYRVMNKPENFEFIHGSNIKYKLAGDKRARQPFKIMDNAISGQLKQPSSAMFDPMSNNSICVNGQLLLLDLVEHLEPFVDLIQNNTDGIVFKVHNYERDFDKIDDIVYEWEQRTGMKMEFDTFFGEIFQKDVNNYCLIDRKTGAAKCKGAYIKKLSPLDYDLPIVNKALVDYMTKNIPVEQTISECDEMIMFQKIVKLSSKYKYGWHATSKYPSDYKDETCKHMKDLGDSRFHLYTCLNSNVHNPDKFGELELNACKCEGCKYYETCSTNSHGNVKLNERTFRVFASARTNDGFIGKQKTDGATIEKFANTPKHCFIYNENVNGVKVPSKLDKQWYIELAKERLKQFGVMQ